MAVSTQAIKVGQADALAKYYAKKEEEIVQDLRSTPEHAQKTDQELREMARVHITRLEAVAFGRNADKAEAALREKWTTQKVGGSAAYYSTDAADRLVHLRGGRAGEEVTQAELKDLFLGQDGQRRLDDPHPKQIEAAARATGYSGEITTEVLESLRSGRDPQTGQELSGAVAEQVAGYWEAPTRKDGDVSAVDITFSAPKGVSLLAAFGSDETREAIYEAQSAAVAKAMSFAEEQGAVNARRGKAGKDLHAIPAELTKVITKNELTSRAGDPQLHTHTILSNYVKGEDGRITALEGQAWHGATAAMDAFYLRALSEELHQRVGVRLEEVVIGDKVRLAGVPGISRALEEQFSTRSRQINEALNERHKERERLESIMGTKQGSFQTAYEAREGGHPQTEEQAEKAAVYQLWLESGTTPQAAALETRDLKAEESEAEALARWAQDASTPDGEKLLRRAQKGSVSVQERELDLEALWERMELDLTEKQASFGASDALSSALRLAPQGVSEAAVMDAGRQFLRERAVSLDSAPDLAQRGEEWRQKSRGWTTEAVLAQRSKIAETAQRLAAQNVTAGGGAFGKQQPAFDQQKLVRDAAEVAAQKTLSAEQEELLAAIVTGQRLVTANGLAGTGKSHALSAAVRALQMNGAEVTVLATKAQLAAELGAEVGANRYMTLHKACDEKYGVFATDHWVQGLNQNQVGLFHELSAKVDEARLNGDTPALEAAETRLAEFQRSLPDRTEADVTAGKRGRVESTDKALKYTEWAAEAVGAEGVTKALGVNDARQGLHKQRMDLIEERSHQPDATTKVDHSKPQTIILDEAAMSADDHMEQLLDYVKAHPNVSLIMVGDYAQLNAVQRSGAFREILEHVDPINLEEIRRAKNEWERNAQSEMHGLAWDNSEETRAKARELVDVYEGHGRLLSAGTEEQVQERVAENPDDAQKRNLPQELAAEAAADWYIEHSRVKEVPQEPVRGKPQEPEQVKESSAVLVPTTQMQTQVATAIQKRLYESGELDPEARKAHLQIKDQVQEVQKGESVTFRTGIPSAGIKNGWSAEVLSVRADGAIRAKVTDERGRSFTKTINKAQLQQGAVALSYSSTVHRAQGQTLDSALYVHDPSKEDMTDRQLIYPALTRGRDSTEVLLVGDRDEAKESLARSMSTSNNASLRAARDAMPTPEDVNEALALAQELEIEPDFDTAKDMAKANAERRALAQAEKQRAARAERSKMHATIAEERKRAEERREQQKAQQKSQSRERVRMF